jgi:hypothetical protein
MATALPIQPNADTAPKEVAVVGFHRAAEAKKPSRRVSVAPGVYQRLDKNGRRVAGSFEFTFRDSTRRQVWQKATGTTKQEAVAQRTALVAAMSAGSSARRSNSHRAHVSVRSVTRSCGI